MKSNLIIEQAIRKIHNSIENGSSTNRAIGMLLLSKYKKQMELPKISEFAKELNISTGAISKFIKSIDLESYSVLRFLFKINSEAVEEKTLSGDDKDIKEVADMVQKANRIVIVGEGASKLALDVFSLNLIKYGFHVLNLNAPGDQK